MPYIRPNDRSNIDVEIDRLVEAIQATINEPTDFAGILNYACTRLALGVLPEYKYWALALVSGVFNTLNLEFYRRVTTPYEEKCIEKNGDLLELR